MMTLVYRTDTNYFADAFSVGLCTCMTLNTEDRLPSSNRIKAFESLNNGMTKEMYNNVYTDELNRIRTRFHYR